MRKQIFLKNVLAGLAIYMILVPLLKVNAEAAVVQSEGTVVNSNITEDTIWTREAL